MQTNFLQIGIVVTKSKRAEKLTELSGIDFLFPQFLFLPKVAVVSDTNNMYLML